MPTRCLKVKLRPGSEVRVALWAQELTRRPEDVLVAMKAEGVRLEAAFLDRQSDGDYMIYVINAADFEDADRIASASPSFIDLQHREFKAQCWAARLPLRPLIDFVVE